MKIDICLSTDDDDYLQHVATMIFSVVNNSPKNSFVFHIITDFMSPASKDKLSKLENENCKIKYVYIKPEVFEDCPQVYDRVKKSTYYRLLVSSLFPELDKIIYFDTDLIINADIAELYKENIDKYYAAAVEDIWCYYNFRGDNNSFYANAGVMLFNTKKMREDNIEEKLFTFIKDNSDSDLVRFMDQDILNYVLSPFIKKVHFRWNVQTFCFQKFVRKSHPLGQEIEEAIRKPAIRHFTGAEKPWSDYLVPHADLYFKYLKQTPYKDNLKAKDFIFGKLEKIFKQYRKHPFLFLKDEISIMPAVIDYKNTEIIKKFGNSKKEIFLNILKKSNFQNKLDKLAKKYGNKKIILYGTGFTADLIFEYFDISKFNIIAVSDKKYKDTIQKYNNIACIPPELIKEKNPDIVFITTQNYIQMEDFFEDILFGKIGKFKYKPLLAYSFDEFIMSFLR